MFSQFLITEVFAFILIFCRLGSAIMLLPGFGEAYVSPRVRLLLAVMFSVLLVPVIRTIPPVPATVFGLLSIVIAEIMVGLFLGAMARLLISAVHMGGMIIAFQSSLASVLVQDVTQIQGQATALGNFLSISALILLFSLDLHHLMLKGVADSYALFVPGQFPMIEDLANHAVQMLNGAFLMAMQLAAPHIVIGIIFYLGAGILARLLPNIHIFFIVIAPQLLLSFFILMVCFSTIMLWYTEYFKNALERFIVP
jgi:flagellar biosynthesis protein FliR